MSPVIYKDMNYTQSLLFCRIKERKEPLELNLSEKGRIRKIVADNSVFKTLREIIDI